MFCTKIKQYFNTINHNLLRNFRPGGWTVHNAIGKPFVIDCASNIVTAGAVVVCGRHHHQIVALDMRRTIIVNSSAVLQSIARVISINEVDHAVRTLSAVKVGILTNILEWCFIWFEVQVGLATHCPQFTFFSPVVRHLLVFLSILDYTAKWVLEVGLQLSLQSSCT